MVIGVVILLNFWYDYHHPLGFLFDIIVAIILIAKYF